MRNKSIIILAALLALGAIAKAQTVKLEARIINSPYPYYGTAHVACDGMVKVLFVESDSNGVIRVELPRGRCSLSYGLDEILLDLRNDTVIEFVIRNDEYFTYSRYRSRQEKDSLLHAKEAKYKANLNEMDTNSWPHRPNYASLALTMAKDIYYPLPHWRTYTIDTVLPYLKYCYLKDRKTYDYLYYPICQMEHRMGIKHDRRVRKPRASNKRWYVPMPEVKENWLTDTVTDYAAEFEWARLNSYYKSVYLEPMGERNLEYPQRKKTIVRLTLQGGLSTPMSLRVENGRFYFRRCDYSWVVDNSNRTDMAFDFALTKAELDTLAQCVAAFDTVKDYVIGPGPFLDGGTFEIELTGPKGYRSFVCYHPDEVASVKPLYDFLYRLLRRHVYRVQFRGINDWSAENNLNAKITIKGRHWYEYQDGGYIAPVPNGKYSILIEAWGHESFEKTIKIENDTVLDIRPLLKQKK
ncbi:MAG: hypothetical protein J5711_00730 [Bacteroidales bacterium]|nr:hypothetical protein [Bacteroidales bacterium]